MVYFENAVLTIAYGVLPMRYIYSLGYEVWGKDYGVEVWDVEYRVRGYKTLDMGYGA